jgi:hypothetical protein
LHVGGSGETLDRVHAVMVEVSSDRTSGQYARGDIVARMRPFTIDPAAFESLDDLASEGIGPRVKAWTTRKQR